MAKFLRKVFLYGILLSSVNYELAYSQVTGQFNIAVDLENNIGSNNNQFQDKETITYNTTIGSYDTSKYEIKSNKNNELMLCKKISPRTIFSVEDRAYPYWKNNDKNYLPININSHITSYCYYNQSVQFYANLKLYFNYNNELAYSISSQLTDDNTIKNFLDLSLSSYKSENMTVNIMITNNNANLSGFSQDWINKIITVYLIDLNNGYSMSNDNRIIYQDAVFHPLYKYSTKPNDTTMKWYKTINAAGDLPADSKDYEPLNKAIFTIISDGELTLSEPEGGGGAAILEVTNFGKLVNSGKLISDNNTIIKSPAISTDHPTLQTLEEIKSIKDAIESKSLTIIQKTYHVEAVSCELDSYGEPCCIIASGDVIVDNINHEMISNTMSDDCLVDYHYDDDSIVFVNSGWEFNSCKIIAVTATMNNKSIEATLDANNKVTSLTVDGKKCDITESEGTTSFTVTNASDDSEIFTATTEDNTTYNISGIGTVTLDGKDYHKLLANLEDVAIDNSNGTIVFKAGCTIDDIVDTKSEPVGTDNDPIIQGGTIDISDLINWSNNTVEKQTGDPHLNIKSAFYNVNIKLIPDTLTDTSTLITYFNDNAKFDSDDKYLFQNMKFFSDIKDSDGNVTETRRSTVSMPVGLSISAEVTENKAKYNTDKEVISTAYFNSDNVLKLFYPASEITEEFKANPPLVVDSTALSVSLYELLNDPQSYISNISVTESTKQLSSEYGLDLIPFVKNDKNVIDYSKFDKNGNTNLDKIQFVSDKNETNSLDLTLLPSYVMDDETKVEDTTIDMKSTYDGWEGLIDPSSYKIKLNTGTYKIKTHEYLAIETTGNVDLYIDNGTSKELSLCELSNSGGTLQVFQNNYKKENENQLTIKLVTRDYKIPSDSTVIINAPMSVHFVRDDIVHTKKVYNEIKDLINDYIKAKIDYNALADKTEAGATDGITAKYTAISSVIDSKLNDISNMLTEIEVSTSTTDYAKYFQKIDENDGKIPNGITGIKSYNEIKTIQNELIQINRYKIEVLKDYLGVLNHYVGTLDGDPKTEVQDKKETISTNISKAKTNQVKMLKNKYYNVTDETELAKEIAAEITELSGKEFPPAAAG